MGITASAWSEAITVSRVSNGLVAAGLAFSARLRFNLLHPRGANGRFIEKGGDVRWRDKKAGYMWRRGTVTDINKDGTVAIKMSNGESFSKDPKELYTAPKAIARLNPNSWKKVGAQGGSNPGGFYKDKNDDTWYVKTLKSTDHVSAEVAAHKLYELVGVAVPEVTSSPDGKKFLTKIEESDAYFDLPSSLHADARESARKNFVTDAWLANWDAPANDNIRFNAEGEALRVDTGGALHYRAQGSPKGSAFGPVVGELNTLRDPSISPQGAKLYAGLTRAEEEENVKRILAIHPDEITALLKEHNVAGTVAQTLIARRAYLANHYGFQLPEDTPEGKAALAMAAEKAKSLPNNVKAPIADLSKAIKRADPKAMPLQLNSPVFIPNEHRTDPNFRGGGDVWIINSVSADKQNITITSVKSNKSVTLPAAHATLLTAAGSMPGSTYNSGEVPMKGDRVHVVRKKGKDTTPYDADVLEVYPKYVRVAKDDGEEQVVSHSVVSLVKGKDQIDAEAAAESAKEETDGKTPATPDSDAQNATQTPDAVAPKKTRRAPSAGRKPTLDGVVFDHAAHDWTKDPFPTVFSEVHGREVRIVAMKRNSKGEVNNYVVTTENVLGNSDTVNPKKTFTKDSVDNAKYAQYQQDLEAWEAKKANATSNAADSTDSKVDPTKDMTSEQKRQYKIDNMTLADVAKMKNKKIAGTLLRGYDAGEEIKPGDYAFTVESKDAKAYQSGKAAVSFIYRDGKYIFAGATDTAYEQDMSSIRSMIARKSILGEEIDGEEILLHTLRSHTDSELKSITSPEFVKAAELLDTSKPHAVSDKVNHVKLSNGDWHDLSNLTTELGLKDDSGSLKWSYTAMVQNENSVRKNNPLFVMALRNPYGDDPEQKIYIAGHSGRMDEPSKWTELTEKQKAYYFRPRHGTNGLYNLTPNNANTKPADDDARIFKSNGNLFDVSDLSYAEWNTRHTGAGIPFVSSVPHQQNYRARAVAKKVAFTSKIPLPNVGSNTYSSTVVTQMKMAAKAVDKVDASELKPGEVPEGFGSPYMPRKLGPEDALSYKIPVAPDDLKTGKLDEKIFAVSMVHMPERRPSNNGTVIAETETGVTHADPVFGALAAELGADATVVKLDSAAFKAYKEQHGTDSFYRGIQDIPFVNDFRAGTQFVGFGVYGNGTYTTRDKSTANSYAGGKAPQVTEFTERPGVTSISSADLRTKMAKEVTAASELFLNRLNEKGLAPSASDLKVDEDNITFGQGDDITTGLPTTGDDLEDGIFRALYLSMATTKDYNGNRLPISLEDRINAAKTVQQAQKISDYYTAKGFKRLAIAPTAGGSYGTRTSQSADLLFQDPDSGKKFVAQVGNVNLERGGYYGTPKTKNAFMFNLTMRADEDATDSPADSWTESRNDWVMASTRMKNNANTAPNETTLSDDSTASTIAAMSVIEKKPISRSEVVLATEYFDTDGSLVTDYDRFHERVEAARTRHDRAKQAGSSYWGARLGDYPTTVQYDHELADRLNEYKQALMAYTRMTYSTDPGRLALALGYDKFIADGVDYHIYTNRNAMIMRKTW